MVDKIEEGCSLGHRMLTPVCFYAEDGTLQERISCEIHRTHELKEFSNRFARDEAEGAD